MTPFDYNERLYKDLIRYGTLLTDIIFEELNVRIQNIKDCSGRIWFVRLQNGNVYDCVNLSDNNPLKRAIYKESQ